MMQERKHLYLVVLFCQIARYESPSSNSNECLQTPGNSTRDVDGVKYTSRNDVSVTAVADHFCSTEDHFGETNGRVKAKLEKIGTGNWIMKQADPDIEFNKAVLDRRATGPGPQFKTSVNYYVCTNSDKPHPISYDDLRSIVCEKEGIPDECHQISGHKLAVDGMTYSGRDKRDIYTVAVGLCSPRDHFQLMSDKESDESCVDDDTGNYCTNHANTLKTKCQERQHLAETECKRSCGLCTKRVNVKLWKSDGNWEIHGHNSTYNTSLVILNGASNTSVLNKTSVEISVCNKNNLETIRYEDLQRAVCVHEQVSSEFSVLQGSHRNWNHGLSDNDVQKGSCEYMAHNNHLIIYLGNTSHIKYVIGLIRPQSRIKVEIGMECSDCDGASPSDSLTDVCWTTCSEGNRAKHLFTSACSLVGSYLKLSVLDVTGWSEVCELSAITVNEISQNTSVDCKTSVKPTVSPESQPQMTTSPNGDRKTDVTTSHESLSTEMTSSRLESHLTEMTTSPHEDLTTEITTSQLGSHTPDVVTSELASYQREITTSLQDSYQTEITTFQITSQSPEMTTSSIKDHETEITTSLLKIPITSITTSSSPIGFDLYGREIRGKCIHRNRTGAPSNLHESYKKAEEIKNVLTLDRKKVTKSIQKKISRKDERKSAASIGILGIVIVTVPFAAIVLYDLAQLFKLCYGDGKKRAGHNKVRPRRNEANKRETTLMTN